MWGVAPSVLSSQVQEAEPAGAGLAPVQGAGGPGCGGQVQAVQPPSAAVRAGQGGEQVHQHQPVHVHSLSGCDTKVPTISIAEVQLALVVRLKVCLQKNYPLNIKYIQGYIQD